MTKPTREERLAWQRELVPGTGLRAWFDRGAWGATGQGRPGTWSWPRAIGQMAIALVLITVLVIVFDTGPASIAGLAIAYVWFILRARSLHRDYLERRGAVERPELP